MQEVYLTDFTNFMIQIRDTTFQMVQQAFISHQNNSPLIKFLGDYVPKLHQYQQQFDQHKKSDATMRKIPSFDGKKAYNNTDNLHRKVISIFKSFLLSQIKDLREYLRMTVDIDHLSQLLSKIDVLRFKSSEFNLIYYLFTSTKRSIRIFLKLREEIIKESTFSSTKYNPISTHNAAKYEEKYYYLDKILVSRKKKEWEELINIAGFEYDDEFALIVFDEREEIEAVELIQFCLWLNKETAKSTQSSPTK